MLEKNLMKATCVFIILIILVGGVNMYGFKEDKCKVEVVAKDNFKTIKGSATIENNSASNVTMNYPERI